MNPFLISLVTIVSIFGLIETAEKFYATRYDHLDVDTILNNRRMVKYYAACLLNEGPCPPQGIEFKRILPEALATNCRRCTEKQKTVALRSIRRLKKEYPKIWSALSESWDPDDVYVKKFEQTFGSKKSTSKPQFINNRFGVVEEEGAKTTIVTQYGPPEVTTTGSLSTSRPKPTTTTPRTTTTTPTVTTTRTTSTTTTTTPRTTSVPITTTTTRLYVSNTNLFNAVNNNNNNNNFNTPTRVQPLGTVGANIQATVSYGTNVVNNFVRNLGTVGKRVIETGMDFAETVLSTVRNVVRPPL